MNQMTDWLSGCYLYQKILIGSFGLIWVVLSLDWWCEALPLSGYGIILVVLIVASCTCGAVCHSYNYLLDCNDTHWVPGYFQKREKRFFNDIFSNEMVSLAHQTGLNEQIRLLVHHIEHDYVKPWYAHVSNNPAFLFDCHLVLEEIMFKILQKLRHCDWKLLAKHVLLLYLSHIQEYKRCLRRNHQTVVDKIYRYRHPALASELAFDHYLLQTMEALVREFAPHDFIYSLQSCLVTRILARKMLKTLVVNLEKPERLYAHLLYLADNKAYLEVTQGRSYLIKEFTQCESIFETHQFRMKPAILSQENSIFNRTLGSNAFCNTTPADNKLLHLPLVSGKPQSNISSVLGGLISSTAAPLLPDNVSLCYQPLNKMWLSPVMESKQEITNSDVLLTQDKVVTLSQSSDPMPQDEESQVHLEKPINKRPEPGQRLVKTHSFDAGSSGDVSPVYEEPEDLATTIAKLRSVLDLKNSPSNSADSEYQISNENTFDQEEESNVACDVPRDGRPFVNVSIPSTEVKETSGATFVLYTIQYDGIYVKENDDGETLLVLQTTIVRRRFEEFLHLQVRLEESPALKYYLKGIKGPSKWLGLPFGTKTDEATTGSRRPVLEKYLQQLCARLEIASHAILHEFMGYGANPAATFATNHTNSSIHKIDKFLSNKVTGVLNSIKTVLPTFDQDAKEVKEEQNLLQGFLNFGNKSEDIPPICLDLLISEATGDTLTHDIRQFLSEKSDCIEDALDVLDNSDWHSQVGDCHVQAATGECVWLAFQESVMDDDLDKLVPNAPVLNLIVDIFCELLDGSNGWLTKEPVVRLIKVMFARWEHKMQERLATLDWDRICGNLLRLLRSALFIHLSADAVNLDADILQRKLLSAFRAAIPANLVQLVGEESVKSAMQLFLNVLRYARCNRDVLLQLFDLLLSQLLSCPHLVDPRTR